MTIKTKINRKDLYDQVWSKPLSHLAKEYGISDVGLKKICKKLDVPTPKGGYWAKSRAGKPVKKIKLPEAQIGAPEVYEITQQKKKTEIELPVEIEQHIKELNESKIIVPTIVRIYHPLVKQAKIYFTNDREDSNGILGGKYQKCINIRVSKKLLSRALRIMHAIIIQLEKRNMQVKIRNENDTYIMIGDIEIRFRLREMLKKVIVPSSYYKDRFESKLEPTGNLILEISEHYYGGDIRKNFKDTNNKQVEQQINDFIINVMKLGIIEKREEEKREEEAEKKQQKKEVLKNKLIKLEAEEEKIKNLFIDIENFNKSQILREYIKTLSEKADINSMTDEKKSEFNTWIKWASHIADCLDPLKEAQLTITEEKNKVKEELGHIW